MSLRDRIYATIAFAIGIPIALVVFCFVVLVCAIGIEVWLRVLINYNHLHF